MCTALAAHVMLLLNREAASRKASGLNFNRDELVVVVCAAIRHVVGPFRLVMDSVLSDGNVLRQFGLEALHPENVQIRFPSELTGPSAVYTILVRHPQFRADSQVEWQDTDLQHHGQHTVEELNYIMESRPEKGLFIYFHDEEPRIDAGRPVPCGYRDILMKRALEQDTDLVRRSEIDCDHPLPWLATLVDRVTSESAVSTASQACLHIRTHHHDDISHATGLVEGDGELVAVSETVRDTIATLNSLEMLRQGAQWTP